LAFCFCSAMLMSVSGPAIFARLAGRTVSGELKMEIESSTCLSLALLSTLAAADEEEAADCSVRTDDVDREVRLELRRGEPRKLDVLVLLCTLSDRSTSGDRAEEDSESAGCFRFRVLLPGKGVSDRSNPEAGDACERDFSADPPARSGLRKLALGLISVIASSSSSSKSKTVSFRGSAELSGDPAEFELFFRAFLRDLDMGCRMQMSVCNKCQNELNSAKSSSKFESFSHSQEFSLEIHAFEVRILIIFTHTYVF